MVADHIVKSYDQDLNHLNTQLVEMGELAVQQLKDAVKAVQNRDEKLATRVIEGDPKVDRFEYEIDSFAIRMIALRQPVAEDLRHIVTALKASNHLERIADYATNIAKRVLSLEETSIPAIRTIPRMAEIAQEMTLDVVKAYVQRDDKKAMDVWNRDAEIDEMYGSFLRELLTYMMEDPRNISPCTHFLFIAKNLERIGDHATNIAEMAHYYVHGTPFEEAREH